MSMTAALITCIFQIANALVASSASKRPTTTAEILVRMGIFANMAFSPKGLNL
ncbi:hypothetical protein [Bradyrhizobium zhanjiangense]|uniref:hypothetical protein n=1 Tax=Bradyrhizobium zhanjiangense TaxID=1325107 RepID=UPI001FDEBC23|nr:hypothetical protein [Bradyrhizobium zhanjiangense]